MREHWTITWDNGTIPGYDDWACAHAGRCTLGSYNLSNPDMRSARPLVAIRATVPKYWLANTKPGGVEHPSIHPSIHACHQVIPLPMLLRRRAAWVANMARAMATGAIDGFFIDITPQALPNRTDPRYCRPPSSTHYMLIPTPNPSPLHTRHQH